MSNDNDGGESSSDSREQGVEFGGLMAELEAHDYPATQATLLEEHGDRELDLADGSETLQSVLAEREVPEEQDTITYGSPDEVHQAVLNMVGDQAVGRTDYSDRGGSLDDDSDQSL